MSSFVLRIKVLLGNLVLLAAIVGAVRLATLPQVAEPAGRIAATVASAWDNDRDDDLVTEIATLEGIRLGLPVFTTGRGQEQRPLAHVLDFGEGPSGAWVQLRFEPGEDSRGPWRLEAHPPSRKLTNAFEMAVGPEGARRFAGEVAGRLETLWEEALLPDLKQRLPAFLGRIDPTKDTEARTVMRSFSKAVMKELDPLLDDLARYVTRAVKNKFDLLDRLGLLVKVVGGDTKGLSKKILPVAKDAAHRWWEENEARVLQAVGAAFAAEFEGLRDWAGGELFDAAREELAEPIFRARRERLEREGEALLKLAADEFVKAPGGGFRVRFSALLRAQLLNKKTALLLLERVPAER